MVLSASALSPIAVLELAGRVLKKCRLRLVAVLLVPVVSLKSALAPMAVLLSPVVWVMSALSPTAVL